MDTQSQLDKHEAECAIRYTAVQEKLEGLDKRLWRLEGSGGSGIVIIRYQL